jgi:hypothetical protein
LSAQAGELLRIGLLGCQITGMLQGEGAAVADAVARVDMPVIGGPKAAARRARALCLADDDRAACPAAERGVEYRAHVAGGPLRSGRHVRCRCSVGLVSVAKTL